MKQTCKYHPGEEATWHCHHDGISFCDDCVGVADSGDEARCFLCNKLTEQRGLRVARDPFWRILSHFVEYPLTRDPMLVALAVCLPLGLLPMDWIGLAIAAGLGVGVAGMGNAMTTATLSGVMRAPAASALKDKDVWVRGFQQWLLFAGVVIAIGMSYVQQGMIVGSLIALGIWLLVPALLVEIHVGGSLINIFFGPQRVIGHMLTIGVDYFYAAGALFALFTGGAIIASILHDLLPNLLGWPLAGMVVAWFWYITSHLVGYLCCQHREALGYSKLGSDQAERKRRARRPEDERRVAVLLREGRYDKVVTLFKTKLEKQAGALELNEQYERLLQALERREDQLEHADQYLNVLLKHNQEFKVVDLIKRYREVDGSFRPGTAQLTWDVAQLLADSKQPKLAVSVLQDLHKRAPTWPQLPQAYLFLARLLKNEFNLEGKAQQYIRFVETRFRQPENQALAKACREELGL